MIKIVGRRWFDRVNGNTYHSVYVCNDDNSLIGKCKFAYGYGEGYLQTAHQILQDAGIYPKTGERFASGADKDYHDFLLDRRENKFFITVSDVGRKKDL